MKGEDHLWGVLNDKLDTLRATNHMAEAIRVGQSALEIAKRSFGAGDIRLALSYLSGQCSPAAGQDGTPR